MLQRAIQRPKEAIERGRAEAWKGTGADGAYPSGHNVVQTVQSVAQTRQALAKVTCASCEPTPSSSSSDGRTLILSSCAPRRVLCSLSLAVVDDASSVYSTKAMPLRPGTIRTSTKLANLFIVNIPSHLQTKRDNARPEESFKSSLVGFVWQILHEEDLMRRQVFARHLDDPPRRGSGGGSGSISSPSGCVRVSGGIQDDSESLPCLAATFFAKSFLRTGFLARDTSVWVYSDVADIKLGKRTLPLCSFCQVSIEVVWSFPLDDRI